MKNCTESLAEKIMANKVPKKLWIYLTVNFITKLLLIAEKNTVLIVCDKLTKMMHFVVTTKKTSAKELAC